jgi:hypothetical protein
MEVIIAIVPGILQPLRPTTELFLEGAWMKVDMPSETHVSDVVHFWMMLSRTKIPGHSFPLEGSGPSP